MEKQPLPIVEAIKFITNDIEIVQKNNLIEPTLENQYVENGLSIILAGIPFTAFITKDQYLTNYFSLDSQQPKFSKARS